MGAFSNYQNEINKLNRKIKGAKSYNRKNKIIRNPGFPSELSENLVKFCYEDLSKNFEWNIKADLWENGEKHEVKCFVSGPISFSPKLDFKSIFFLDAKVWKEHFILYQVCCNSQTFKKLKVNKEKKFSDFELSGTTSLFLWIFKKSINKNPNWRKFIKLKLIQRFSL